MNTQNTKGYSIIAIAIAIPVLCIYWIFFSGVSIKNLPPKNDTIIAFGDSLTVGVGATPQHDYVTLLSQKLGKPITNAGVSGDTSARALLRLDSDVLSQNPGVVIVLIGGNDFLQSVPVSETFKNISTIVEKIEASGSAVVLVGIRGGVLSDPYADEFEKIHTKYGTAFVSNIMQGLVTHSELLSDDKIHPNDDGYQVFFDRIYPVVKRLY